MASIKHYRNRPGYLGLGSTAYRPAPISSVARSTFESGAMAHMG